MRLGMFEEGSSSNSGVAKSPPPRAPRKTSKILVADDDDGVRSGLVANLELEGYEVSEAHDGAEAIQMLSASVYDLILSDVVMPSATGLEVLSAARRRQNDTPFILISGFVSDELENRALGEGLFAMLYKPLRMELILGVVARALRRGVVMIVVDSSSHTASLGALLQAVGMRVESCADGASALSFARAHAVDVCVLDLTVEPAAGRAVCAALRKLETPMGIIAIVGLTRQGTPGAEPPLGVETLLPPVVARDLLSTIARVRASSAAIDT